MPQSTFQDLGRAALAELAAAFAQLHEQTPEPLIEAIAVANRIVVYGCGREGLQIHGFAMRLFHLGRNVSVVGDMTTPPVGSGDLLIVSCGTGRLPTGEALIREAREAGAVVACITSQPAGSCPALADIVITLPAQTMADDQGSGTSVLPMGSLFETLEMIFFELVVLRLRDGLKETAESMRARHTNLE